jgi:hypothetical protein
MEIIESEYGSQKGKQQIAELEAKLKGAMEKL